MNHKGTEGTNKRGEFSITLRLMN